MGSLYIVDGKARTRAMLIIISYDAHYKGILVKKQGCPRSYELSFLD